MSSLPLTLYFDERSSDENVVLFVGNQPEIRAKFGQDGKWSQSLLSSSRSSSALCYDEFLIYVIVTYVFFS